MNITFRQLRLFLALAETGSVSAAARVMHVTQPTASMQLREVTQAVGLPLYEVVSRRVHLTEAGQALARTARAIAGEWDAFEQRVSGAKGLTSGRLKVAVVSTAKYFVPRLLGSFCKLHPQIDISLEVLNRDHVITRLRSNLDDLYVMSMPPADLPLEDYPSTMLLRLAQAIQQQVSATYARAHGLSVAEWRMLARLNSEGSVQLATLCRALAMDKAYAGRLLRSLGAQSLVTVEADPAHGRRLIVAITPAGRALARRILPQARASQEQLLQVLDPQERAALYASLKKLQAALDDTAPQPASHATEQPAQQLHNLPT